MSVKKRPISPRQKMINLLYIVLMAMLALNVSSDVLIGFSLVDESLRRTTSNATEENKNIYKDFEEQLKANSEKVAPWYAKAQHVKAMSDSLYNFAESLKHAIVEETDGKDGNINNIKNKEDLDAATSVMLGAGHSKGAQLFEAVTNFREFIITMISNDEQKALIQSNLSTEIPKRDEMMARNWQEYMFEGMPTAAAVTILTKLQSDVRYAESHALQSLISNIDLKDVRVNQLNAYVIPNSRTIVQGDKFSANIIMAAVDSTQRPDIFIDGKSFNNPEGLYERVCNQTGEFTLKGYIQLPDGEGNIVRRSFEQQYNVIAPSATVSADLMNVLYAGFDNPISMSVPVASNNKILATMKGGTLISKGGGKFIARPATVGSDAIITVSANMDGRIQRMGEYKFKVRRLPDPTAFIAYQNDKGETIHYRGGGRAFSKSLLLKTKGIGAAIDDGLLNIPFNVLSFETVFFDNMGNAVPEVSNSANFTERQRSIFSRLSRGRRFYISNIKTKGPDGIERTLSQSLEVIVN